MNCTVHLIIKGKVQGVFYRATAKEVAQKLQVTGWIKNTQEGDVEAMVSGGISPVDQFVQWCKKGPAKARIDEVIVSEKEYISFNTFEIRK